LLLLFCVKRKLWHCEVSIFSTCCCASLLKLLFPTVLPLLFMQRLTYLLQEAGQARASAFAAEALQAGQEGAAVQAQGDVTVPPLQAEALVQEVLDAL
jgi:hypothetical protein